MKRKLRRRNQRWLSEQYRCAKINKIPMDFVVKFPEQQAEMDNANRLKRRGKLLPNWDKASFYDCHAAVPFINPHGKVYYYQVFMSKDELPDLYQSLWGHRLSSADTKGGLIGERGTPPHPAKPSFNRLSVTRKPDGRRQKKCSAGTGIVSTELRSFYYRYNIYIIGISLTPYFFLSCMVKIQVSQSDRRNKDCERPA
ncbi:hypothetical protein [Xenorhabdus bovienii]|uniref:Uncharacterized protein n=2 Tax=Xenorhabdus bovienii TaxID=40576 RepID=A0A0B6X6C0_XENBV|nr:hypothetical protein [Xenorhabdus bovienii]CDH01725.1 conserved hypothetical protein [Xenorhabdus bovienii str. feltiae Moldova]CDM89452.1 conserved protein of unknown function [Xenorhabdus bovienii]